MSQDTVAAPSAAGASAQSAIERRGGGGESRARPADCCQGVSPASFLCVNSVHSLALGPSSPICTFMLLLRSLSNGLPKLPRDALGENIKFEGGSAPISMQGAKPCHPAQQDRGEGKRHWTRGEASYGDENTPPHSRSRSADGRSPLCPVDCPLGLCALRSTPKRNRTPLLAEYTRSLPVYAATWVELNLTLLATRTRVPVGKDGTRAYLLRRSKTGQE